MFTISRCVAPPRPVRMRGFGVPWADDHPRSSIQIQRSSRHRQELSTVKRAAAARMEHRKIKYTAHPSFNSGPAAGTRHRIDQEPPQHSNEG